MPQMYPLLWMFLFITFSLLFIIFMTKMYFFFMNNSATSTSSNLKNSLINKNWMW